MFLAFNFQHVNLNQVKILPQWGAGKTLVGLLFCFLYKWPNGKAKFHGLLRKITDNTVWASFLEPHQRLVNWVNFLLFGQPSWFDFLLCVSPCANIVQQWGDMWTLSVWIVVLRQPINSACILWVLASCHVVSLSKVLCCFLSIMLAILFTFFLF